MTRREVVDRIMAHAVVQPAKTGQGAFWARAPDDFDLSPGGLSAWGETVDDARGALRRRVEEAVGEAVWLWER